MCNLTGPCTCMSAADQAPVANNEPRLREKLRTAIRAWEQRPLTPSVARASNEDQLIDVILEALTPQPATDSERVDQIRARDASAAKGPWLHEPWGGQNQNGDYTGGNVFDADGEYLVSDIADVDGAFIAHAREDVPYLLAEHDRLTALLAEQAATIERVRALHRPVPYGEEKLRAVAPWVPENVCDHCIAESDGCAPYPCPTITALGSQRTEGDRG